MKQQVIKRSENSDGNNKKPFRTFAIEKRLDFITENFLKSYREQLMKLKIQKKERKERINAVKVPLPQQGSQLR